VANFDNIGEASLDQVLVRRLTTPGGAVAPTVAPELFPVITLENDRPEWGYPKGERLCAATVFATAVAGQFCSAQLYLPSTSRELIVVKAIVATTTNTINIQRLVGIGGGGAGWGARTTLTRDFRWNAERTSGILEQRTNAVAPTSFSAIAQLSGVLNASITEPIVISPGTALGINCAIVNTQLSALIYWTERGAQPGELI